MRRTTTWLAGFTTALTLIAGPAIAAKPSTTPKGPKTTVARPTAPKTLKVSGPPAKASAPKVAKTSTPKSAHATPSKAAKTGGATIGGSTWKPTNPVAQKLSTKTQMLAKVQRVLPGITDLNAATAGFKNYGQFVAAVNATQNQGVDFAKLKALMTGINLNGTPTGRPTLSLGQAKKVLLTTPTTAPGTTTPAAH